MIIIDTNIWVSYMLAPKSPLGQKVRQLIREQAYAFSDHTFVELTDVLMRDKFDRFVSPQERAAVLKRVAQAAEWFRPTEKIDDCRDPKDNKFLELALAASATLERATPEMSVPGCPRGLGGLFVYALKCNGAHTLSLVCLCVCLSICPSVRLSFCRFHLMCFLASS